MDPVDADIADYDFLSDIGDPDHFDHDDGDFSDPEIEKYFVNSRNRLFGRQRPLHLILGGGLCADIILWRNKEISAWVLFVATNIWLVFEWINYHFLALLCQILLLSLSYWFLWYNIAVFTDFMPPPEFPDAAPEGSFVEAALLLRRKYNQATRTLRDDVILGTDFKGFLMVVWPLGVLSVVSNWFNFLTLVYIVIVILMTVPVLYENYEDIVDPFVEKSIAEMRRQYVLLNEKIHCTLQNIGSCLNN